MMGLTFKSMTVKLHDTESKHQGQGQGEGTKYIFCPKFV
jgi:hypothetical protein